MIRMTKWLEMAEERLQPVSTSGANRTQVETSLREAVNIQSELARKKPELSALTGSAQVEELSSLC